MLEIKTEFLNRELSEWLALLCQSQLISQFLIQNSQSSFICIFILQLIEDMNVTNYQTRAIFSFVLDTDF